LSVNGAVAVIGVLRFAFRMENVHIFQVFAQVGAFVGTEDAQRKAQQGPQVDGFPGVVALFGQVVDLGVAVVAGRDGVRRPGGQDLVGLKLAVFSPFVGKAGLQETAAAAAAEIVGAVGVHIDEIFFTHHSLDYVA